MIRNYERGKSPPNESHKLRRVVFVLLLEILLCGYIRKDEDRYR